MQGQVDAIEHMVAKGGDNIESNSGEEDKKPETDENARAASTLLNLAKTISVQLKNFTSATSCPLIYSHAIEI